MDRGALQLWKDFERARPFFLLLGSRMSWKMYSVTVVPWSESVPGSQEIILIKKRRQSTWPSRSCHNRGSSYPDDPYHIVIQRVTCVFFFSWKKGAAGLDFDKFQLVYFLQTACFCFVSFRLFCCFVLFCAAPVLPTESWICSLRWRSPGWVVASGSQGVSGAFGALPVIQWLSWEESLSVPYGHR